ncbi:MAG TPA: RDD family protein [Chitinophagaceae bacterium]|jgi:uncharacterized RDD family membrane protein YckC|nr:RDD family protein [Chitinophagaceae bacterium]
MAFIRVTTSFNIDIEFEAAPFHRRLFAWMIDMVLLIFYGVLMARIMDSLQRKMTSDDDAYNMWGIGLLLYLPAILYHPLCEIFMQGQSVGKRLMKLQVVSENGGRAGISQIIIRFLIRTADYTILMMIYIILVLNSFGTAVFGMVMYFGLGFSLLLLITDIVLVNSKKQQRLGDLLAHTLLVRTRQKAAIEDTVFQQVADDYIPQFPQVMRLSDRDINAIKSILEAARKNRDADLAVNASDKIRAHLNIQTELPPYTFLEVLLKDYNSLAGT